MSLIFAVLCSITLSPFALLIILLKGSYSILRWGSRSKTQCDIYRKDQRFRFLPPRFLTPGAGACFWGPALVDAVLSPSRSFMIAVKLRTMREILLTRVRFENVPRLQVTTLQRALNTGYLSLALFELLKHLWVHVFLGISRVNIGWLYCWPERTMR